MVLSLEEYHTVIYKNTHADVVVIMDNCSIGQLLPLRLVIFHTAATWAQSAVHLLYPRCVECEAGVV